MKDDPATATADDWSRPGLRMHSADRMTRACRSAAEQPACRRYPLGIRLTLRTTTLVAAFEDVGRVQLDRSRERASAQIRADPRYDDRHRTPRPNIVVPKAAPGHRRRVGSEAARPIARCRSCRQLSPASCMGPGPPPPAFRAARRCDTARSHVGVGAARS